MFYVDARDARVKVRSFAHLGLFTSATCGPKAWTEPSFTTLLVPAYSVRMQVTLSVPID